MIDAIEEVRQFVADTGKPQTLVCNDAGDFNLNKTKQLCIKPGVRLEFSSPYRTEENNIVERYWGTITPMMRCLIGQS